MRYGDDFLKEDLDHASFWINLTIGIVNKCFD